MIVTLCGSARFEPWFHMWTDALTQCGHAVQGLSVYPSTKGGNKDWYTSDQKRELDSLHIEKILSSDAVLFLNPFAYIGESTLRELNAAIEIRKQILFLQSWGIGCGIGPMHNEKTRAAARAYGVPDRYGSPVATHWYRSPWDGPLVMGPAGRKRSSIVEMVLRREEEAYSWRPSGAVA